MKNILRIIYGILLIAAGISHFLFPAFYEPMVPDYLPNPKLLTILSGVAEIALGALLIWPVTARLACWGVIALLIAVFPANVYMATHPELFPQYAAWSLWLRLPLQSLLITLAYWLSKK